jgi:hypothetical protein
MLKLLKVNKTKQPARHVKTPPAMLSPLLTSKEGEHRETTRRTEVSSPVATSHVKILDFH